MVLERILLNDFPNQNDQLSIEMQSNTFDNSFRLDDILYYLSYTWEEPWQSDHNFVIFDILMMIITHSMKIDDDAKLLYRNIMHDLDHQVNLSIDYRYNSRLYRYQLIFRPVIGLSSCNLYIDENGWKALRFSRNTMIKHESMSFLNSFHVVFCTEVFLFPVKGSTVSIISQFYTLLDGVKEMFSTSNDLKINTLAYLNMLEFDIENISFTTDNNGIIKFTEGHEIPIMELYDDINKVELFIKQLCVISVLAFAFSKPCCIVISNIDALFRPEQIALIYDWIHDIVDHNVACSQFIIKLQSDIIMEYLPVLTNQTNY